MKKLLSLILILSLLVACLTSCITISNDNIKDNSSNSSTNQSISSLLPSKENADYFKCIYKKSDYDNYIETLNKLKKAVIDGNSREDVENLYNLSEEMASYLSTQCSISQIVYYSEKSDEANEKYKQMDEYSTNASAEYFKIYREMYNSSSEFKDVIFNDWTETDINSLSNLDIDKYTRSKTAMNDILLEFMELNSDDADWANKVNELYFDHVKQATIYANAWGYDNYYDYMSQNAYYRDYSAKDRNNFRKYVKQYIVPLYNSVNSAFGKLDISYADYYALTSLISESHKNLDKDYLTEFINSFGGSINEKMLSIFENNRILYGSQNSEEAAFTVRLDYYDDTVCFFAEGYYQSLPTFVHELGHYVSLFNYSESGNCYDLLETRSQGTEWLLLYHLKSKLSDSLYELYFLNSAYTLLDTVIRCAIIDEFEETVYKASVPYTCEQYDTLLKSISDKYGHGLYDNLRISDYIKHIYIQNPVYYLSYATSALCSADFFVISDTKGYNSATEVYRKLQEGEDCKGFVHNIELAGLSNPFDESTYKALTANITKYIG